MPMSWFGRLWNTIRPGRIEREIDREIAFHLAERIDDLEAQGLARDEATRRARLQLGNLSLQSDRTRDMHVTLWVDAFVRDVKYALTSLGRTPGFAVAVILTLALGIGANGAVFSAVNAVLLQPLPFPDGDRLMRLGQIQQRSAENNIAPVRLEDWHRLNETFDAITGYYVEDVSETSGEFPERVRRASVAPRFVEVWRMPPARGRGFTALEHSDAGPRAVLVSDRFWRVRLGADPDVLQRSVRIGSASFPIVGVMPGSFRFPDRDVDLWFPIALDNKYAQSRRNTWYTGIGRMKPGVTVEQARANLIAVQTQLGKQYPDSDRELGVDVEPLKQSAIGDVGRSLWLLFGGVLVVLLITCTNIAGLLLSRATHRHQEIAVRLALGASRTRVALQLLVETLLLSMAGALVGLLVAAGAVTQLRSAAAALPRIDEIAIDWTVVAYTFTTALVVTVLCGVLPAFRAGRDTMSRSLTEGSRSQASSRHGSQWLLVGAQVAMSVVLLAGAGLLIRSIQELSRIDLGFDASHVLTFRVSGDFSETVNSDRLIARIDGTIDALRALPGVESVATSVFLPGVASAFENAFTVVEAGNTSDRQLGAESRVVSPEYFQTLKISVLEGEVCGRQPSSAPRLVMINRSFQSRYLSSWPSPIGLHLTAGGSRQSRIVAVVADARDRGVDRDPAPTVYRCGSAPNPTPWFLVRTHGDPVDLTQTVRLTMREREPLRSVYDLTPLDDRIGGAFAQNRLRTNVLSLFALSALALAAVGLYGTLNYIVNRRRREVGLRLALGAVRMTIVRQFFAQGLKVIALSCAAGLVLALTLTRLLEGMLFGVSPTDPIVMASVVAIVFGVSIVGALIPAARASLIEPMRVLREE
jgi:putative ABC transport system permease protein